MSDGIWKYFEFTWFISRLLISSLNCYYFTVEFIILQGTSTCHIIFIIVIYKYFASIDVHVDGKSFYNNDDKNHDWKENSTQLLFQFNGFENRLKIIWNVCHVQKKRIFYWIKMLFLCQQMNYCGNDLLP